MTNRDIERIIGKNKVCRYGLGDGLTLCVSPNGNRKRFVYLGRRPGNRVKGEFKIGLFHPTTFTLEDARAAVAKHKATLAAGGDPTPRTKSKTRRRTAPPPPPPTGHTKEMTVGQLCDLFVAHKTLTCSKNTIADSYLPQIKNYIKPPWGAWPVSALKYGIIKAELDQVAARSNAQARGTFKCLSSLFSYGLELADHTPSLEALTHHPIMGRKKPGKKIDGRARTLNNAELKKLVAVLRCHGDNNDGVNYWAREQRAAAQMLHLELLTAARGSEVRTMRWSDVAVGDDGDLVWTIPAEASKNHHAHDIPITPYAAAVLHERGLNDTPTREHLDIVFPTRFKRLANTPVGETRKAMATVYKAAGLVLSNKTNRGTVPHDLRRTVSQWLETLGYMDEEVGRVLNHRGRAKRNTVTKRHYTTNTGRGGAVEHRVPALALKRQMLKAWGDHLYGTILGDEMTVRRAKRAS